MLFLSDRYRFTSGKSCHGIYGNAYSTISSAKAGCNQDRDCTMIIDIPCTGKAFKFCKGPIIDSSIGSCVWSKRMLNEAPDIEYTFIWIKCDCCNGILYVYTCYFLLQQLHAVTK